MSAMYVYANNTQDPLKVSKSNVSIAIEDVKPVVACRCCLVTDQPLQPLDHKLVDAYGLLTSSMDQSAIQPKFICMYCRALLRKFMSFREKCLFAQSTLTNIHSMGIPITLELLKSCFLISPYPLKKTDTLVIHLEDDKSSPPTQNVAESCASNSVVQNVLQTEPNHFQIKEENTEVENIDDEIYIFIEKNNGASNSNVWDNTDLPKCLNNITTVTSMKDIKQNSKECSGKIKQVKPRDTKQLNEEHYSASDCIEGTDVDMSIGDGILYTDSDENVSAASSSAVPKIKKPLKVMSKKKISRAKVDKLKNRKGINVRNMKAWIEQIKSERSITSDDDDNDGKNINQATKSQALKAGKDEHFDHQQIQENSDEDLNFDEDKSKLNIQDLRNWTKTAKARTVQKKINEQIMKERHEINEKKKTQKQGIAEFEKNFDVKIMALSKDQQIQQINERKNTDKYKNAKYKCDLCYHGFNMKVTYENHMASHKPVEGQFMCEICKKYYPRRRLLLHMSYSHSDDYICNQCDHVSKSRNVKTLRKNRKLTRKVGGHTEDQMKKALAYVKDDGLSIRRAAANVGMAYATLSRYVNIMKNNETGHLRLTPHYNSRLIFTEEQEETLNEYFMSLALMFYGLTLKTYKTLAHEIAIRNNVTVPDSWKETHMAGKDWLRGFRERFPNVTVRQHENSTSSNKEYVDRFYDKLQKVLSRNPAFADGTRIYNLDETTTDSQNQNPTRGQKNVSSGEKGTIVTTCNIISARGQALPPVFVFPSVEVSEGMQVGTPSGSLILAASSGLMNNSLFPDVIQHFVKHTGSTEDHPTLLIMDNHESHISIDALNLATDAGVTIVTLHQSTSDRLQPLDVGLNGPFKSYYSSAMEFLLINRPRSTVTIHDIGELLGQAFDTAMTPANIKSAFKKTGIFPFDRNVLSEDESSVTDKPQPEDAEQPIDPNVIDSPRTESPIQIEEAGPCGLQAPPLINNDIDDPLGLLDPYNDPNGTKSPPLIDNDEPEPNNLVDLMI